MVYIERRHLCLCILQVHFLEDYVFEGLKVRTVADILFGQIFVPLSVSIWSCDDNVSSEGFH